MNLLKRIDLTKEKYQKSQPKNYNKIRLKINYLIRKQKIVIHKHKTSLIQFLIRIMIEEKGIRE